jgi:general secretion pathway protein J
VKPRGFTLLELLIAVTLLAALTALLFGGVRAGVDGAARLDRRLEAVDDLRIAQTVLRRLLTAAQPLAQVPGGRLIAFDGRGDGIDFIAALPPALGGGLAQLRLRLDKTGRLELLRAPLGKDGAGFDFATADTSLLLDKAKEITLDYFGPDSTGKPAWFKSWREVDALPTLVRLRVDSPSPLPWPELVIAPRSERGER